jgi:PAS domain S-box-containing protein
MAARIRGDSRAGSSFATGRPRFLGRPGWGLVAGLATLALVTALDVIFGEEAVLTGSYLVAPFVAALSGSRRATAAVGALAIALAAASGAWNGSYGGLNYDLRIALLVLATGVAYMAAAARSKSQAAMRRFQILDEIAAVADGSLPLAQTLERVTDVIVPEVADICMIDVNSEGRPTRAAVRAGGPNSAEVEAWLWGRQPTIPDYLFRDKEMPLAEPWFVPKHNQEFLRRISQGPGDLEYLRSLGTRSSVSVGFGARGKRLGALTMVTAWSRRRYRGDDVRFARVLAGRVGLVLDNAGLFSDLQSVERRMDTAMSILGEAVVIQDRRGQLLYANDAAATMFGGAPEQLAAVTLEEIRARYDLYEEHGAPLDPSEFVGLRVLRGVSGHDQTIRVVERESRREHWLRARSRAIEGTDGQPLYAVTTFDDVTESKQAEFAQAMLARTGELLASSIDYRETLQGVARITIPQLADWCFVCAPGDDGAIELLAIAHSDPDMVRLARRIAAEFPIAMGDTSGAAEALRSTEPSVVEDAEAAMRAIAEDERHLEMLRELGIGSGMVFPIRSADQGIGALVLANGVDRRPFDEFDRSLAGQIAERASIAIENSRLATERASIAETLQQGLAPPQIPTVPGWSAAAVYRPAGTENRVGGDFYDFFPFEGGWMVVIGDVTGRGAEAATVTALARYTIRTAGTLTGDPISALNLLHESLLAREGNALCSAAIATLGGEGTDDVKIAVAGHPLPLIVRDGLVEEGGHMGPVLGAFADSRWESETCSLAPGEQLVVYTDGVTEACGQGDRFGDERLRRRLAASSSPADSVRQVENALEAFTAGNLTDDAALVAVMREPARLPSQSLSGVAGSGESESA